MEINQSTIPNSQYFLCHRAYRNHVDNNANNNNYDRGQTYVFDQQDPSNWFHALGFAYEPDGAHEGVDELEEGIGKSKLVCFASYLATAVSALYLLVIAAGIHAQTRFLVFKQACFTFRHVGQRMKIWII